MSRLCAHALPAMTKQIAQRSRFVMAMECVVTSQGNDSAQMQPFGNAIKLRDSI